MCVCVCVSVCVCAHMQVYAYKFVMMCLCVYTFQLHTRETWLKEGRVVRVGEQAYKMVKARPKRVSDSV